MFTDDKKRYVSEAYSNEKSGQSVLYSLLLFKGYEAIWNADFTEQPIDVLQPAFNRVVSTTSSGASATLHRLRQYAAWRRKKGLPCGEGVFDLEIDTTVAIRERMVASPEQLAALLNAVFDPPWDETHDVVYRVFLWMALSGLDDRRALWVTVNAVDLDSLTIRDAGSAYPIYPDAVDDFRYACMLDAFWHGQRKFRRAQGDEIMRGRIAMRRDRTDSMLRTIRPELARKFRAASEDNRNRSKPLRIGFDITFDRVRMSGVFYRMYELEQLGRPPDFDAMADAAFQQAMSGDKPYRNSDKNPKAATLLRIRRRIETDYDNWKRAFGLAD